MAVTVHHPYDPDPFLRAEIMLRIHEDIAREFDRTARSLSEVGMTAQAIAAEASRDARRLKAAHLYAELQQAKMRCVVLLPYRAVA